VLAAAPFQIRKVNIEENINSWNGTFSASAAKKSGAISGSAMLFDNSTET